MITCTFENGGKAQLRHVVVHAIVEKNSKLLLVKRAPGLLEEGKWSLPSGFLDRDETASQCALRELKEEIGWEGNITSIFRINTNPNRPHEDRQNVSIDFICQVTKETGIPDKENTKIEWIPIEQLLPFDQFAFDHGSSIEKYLKYKAKAFLLPIID